MAYNMLIVDDSSTTRAIIAKTLKLTKIPIGELYMASNGKEALGLLNKEWIDIVLTDINMPVMNGIEMIKKMAEDGLLKTIPVVVISTEGSKTRIKELKSKGISAYIRKPFTPEKLNEVINDIMGV